MLVILDWAKEWVHTYNSVRRSYNAVKLCHQTQLDNYYTAIELLTSQLTQQTHFTCIVRAVSRVELCRLIIEQLQYDSNIRDSARGMERQRVPFCMYYMYSQENI